MSAENVLSAARLALAVRRLKEERPDFAILQAEPLAVTGIGCRLPGNVSTPEDCWRVLADGIDTITEIPAGRWNAREYYDPDPQAPGKTNTRWGGFVPDAGMFDPVLFGISPREAANIDPQQRLLLEVAWEAIQDSGRAPESLAGGRAGVFVGVSLSDYERMALEDVPSINGNSCSGAYRSVASGRISYLLDLRGPSISIDTACSSSLVAIHSACQSLRSGESDLALAGGVCLHLLPEHYVGLAKLGMLSPDGSCKVLDAGANGFVPSEGCGMVVLKRLSDALADGDRIYAVIRGSAINQDGRTNSLTAPSGLAQQDVVAAALRNAQVPPSAISYVEMHGTGTSLGDPIEVEALAAALGAPREGAPACALGAAKSNFGHLEAAAGVTGFIKAVLALSHEEIPGNLHFQKLNPNISLEGTRFQIPVRSTAWPRGHAPRFAGVSSFGFSGTNAHVVLEEAPRLPVRQPSHAVEPPYTLLVSARTPSALNAAARAYRNFLTGRGRETALYDICHASALRCSHYEERLALTASTHVDTGALIDEYLEGRRRAGISCGRASGKAESLVFVCSGQGSQWPRMGLSLLRQEPVFRAALEECEAAIQRWAGWPLVDRLSAPESESKLADTEFAQPVIFAIQVALARLFQSWGVRPAAVIGHSAGEIAAAHIAGVLSLSEAARVVVMRGRLMQAATGKGKMAAVRLPAASVAEELSRYGGGVSIAAINSPQSTVVSGEGEQVDALLAGWSARGIGSVPLSVNYAFHSAQMQPFGEALARSLGKVETSAGNVAIFSTVLGRLASGAEFDAAYWGRNVRQPVRFGAAVEAAIRNGQELFIEIAAHPVLQSAIGECLAAGGLEGDGVPTLRRGQPERAALMASLGALHTAGYAVSWKAVYRAAAPPVTLPAYPYQRQYYWLERPATVTSAHREAARDIYVTEWRLSRRGAPANAARVAWDVAGDDAAASERMAAALDRSGIPISPAPSGARGLIWLAEPRPKEDPVATGMRILRSVMAMAQELIRQPSREPARLWLVTRAAIATGGAPACPGFAQSPLWGMFRSVAMEHPELSCVRVDLDAKAPDYRALAEEIANWDGEEEIALHAAGRFVPRLATVTTTPSAQAGEKRIRATSTYVITGGMGGLGLQSAEWLVRKGARTIVLVGRRAPSAHAAEIIQTLRGQGARIEIRLADVADHQQVSAVFSEIERRLPPLAGILHTAGVLDDGIFLEQTWPRMEKVFRSKAAGAWNLHQLTAGKALDFLVLFSSVASLTGSPGQSGYAAANAFLDALAHYRHGLGLAALSVNWGAWAGSGMAAQVTESGRRRVLASIRPMTAERCFTALELGLADGRPQLVIADADWSRWNPAPRLLLPFLPQGEAQRAASRETEILSRLESTPPARRRTILVEFLRTEVAAILGMDASGPYLDERVPLLRMGMDSLMTVEFRNRLAAALGRPLSATLVFDHPTIGALADFLSPASQPEEELPQPDKLLQELEGLSEEDAEELLKAELDRV
jgi:acyl transferase domain-containing protein